MKTLPAQDYMVEGKQLLVDLADDVMMTSAMLRALGTSWPTVLH